VGWLFADRMERIEMRRGTAAHKQARAKVAVHLQWASAEAYEAGKLDAIAKADERKGDKKGAATARQFAQWKRNSVAHSLLKADQLQHEADTDTRLTWPNWLKD